MALMKQVLSDTPDGAWQLVYETERKELYVEVKTSNGIERVDIDRALRMSGDGPDELHLAIVDMFKGDDA
jgi:hypothetical protein